jgi:hypothetical protein
MGLCASCGQRVDGDLCPHHLAAGGDNWAAANRILCDLLHRKKAPARLPRNEREDEL